MAASLIRIDTQALAHLESQVRSVSGYVLGSVETTLVGAPHVDAKYDEFVKKWDKRRDQLFERLDEIAKVLQAVRQSFEANDHELASALLEAGSK
jgi:hypothetical protein